MLRLVIFQGFKRAAIHGSPRGKLLLQSVRLQPRVVKSGLPEHRSIRGFHATNPLTSTIKEHIKKIVTKQLDVRDEQAGRSVPQM